MKHLSPEKLSRKRSNNCHWSNLSPEQLSVGAIIGGGIAAGAIIAGVIDRGAFISGAIVVGINFV